MKGREGKGSRKEGRNQQELGREEKRRRKVEVEEEQRGGGG
jgi:hypothetical protein